MSSKRVWYQSFVDPVAQSNYIGQLQKTLNKFAGEGSEFEVHGLSPPDTGLHALTEFRCAAQVLENSLQAQEEGFDPFVTGHFQEPGLHVSRKAGYSRPSPQVIEEFTGLFTTTVAGRPGGGG